LNIFYKREQETPQLPGGFNHITRPSKKILLVGPAHTTYAPPIHSFTIAAPIITSKPFLPMKGKALITYPQVFWSKGYYQQHQPQPHPSLQNFPRPPWPPASTAATTINFACSQDTEHFPHNQANNCKDSHSLQL
jgi:hypothetical protein